MKTLKNYSTAFLFFLVLAFSACTEDTNMDEIIDNTEINSPSPASGNDPSTESEEDKPGG